MRIIRVQAVQAHAVPKSVTQPRGPFPPEMQGYNPGYASLSAEGADFSSMEYYEDDASPAAQPEIITDYMSEDDEGHSSLPDGATAQNNYRAPKYYRCKTCYARLEEQELDDHDCE